MLAFFLEMMCVVIVWEADTSILTVVVGSGVHLEDKMTVPVPALYRWDGQAVQSI